MKNNYEMATGIFDLILMEGHLKIFLHTPISSTILQMEALSHLNAQSH